MGDTLEHPTVTGGVVVVVVAGGIMRNTTKKKHPLYKLPMYEDQNTSRKGMSIPLGARGPTTPGTQDKWISDTQMY